MNVIFTKMSYVTTYGNVIDISDLVLELNIFQSITDHYMQCEIVMQDAVALSALATPQDTNNKINGGFSGGELLVVEYTVDSPGNPTNTNVFALYEISNRSKIKDTMESYIIHGISLEALDSYPRKISRAFGGSNGNTVANMLKSVVNEYVYSKNVRDVYGEIKKKIQMHHEKSIITSETSGLQRFVIPNLSVDDTIEFFCNEAQAAGETSRYIFWERQEGFYFYNLEDLVGATPVMDYYYSEFNTNITDRDQRIILSYDVIKETNFLENTKEGLFKSKTIALDVLKKKKYETVFDYNKIKSGDKYKKMQSFYHAGEVTSDDANVTLMTTRRGHDCQCQLFRLENHLPKRIDQFLSERKSYIRHIFNTYLSVVVPGTTLLNAGDTIILNFPFKGLVPSAELVYDAQISGKYLITKIMNKFSLSKKGSYMTTHIECVKDTQIESDVAVTAIETPN